MKKSDMRKAFALVGRKGGRKAAKKLAAGKTPEQLSETMRAVANARWKAVREAKAAEVQERAS